MSQDSHTRREILSYPREFSGWIHEVGGDIRMPHAHTHADLELNLVLQGSARYLMQQGRYDLVPFNMVWLFPHQEHILVDCSKDFRAWVLVFRPRLVRETAREPAYRVLASNNPPGQWIRRLSLVAGQRIDRMVCELAVERANHCAAFNAGLPYLLRVAFDLFEAATPMENQGPVHPAVERAARLLRDGPPDTETQLAAAAGLSRSRLSRLFHEQTGVPLVQYRNRLRVERFIRSRENSPSLTLLAAALEAGFGSYAQFYRVFRQITGQRPAEWHRSSG